MQGVEEFPSCRAARLPEAREPAARVPQIDFGGNMPISKELLEILACPKCKGDIRLNEKGDGLICEACRLVYEIKDDIPIMLIDEAKPLK
jgi:uncharacterized protein YbaR (Trm112 family)